MSEIKAETDQWAADVMRRAWKSYFQGDEPDATQLQMMLGQACLESIYGRATNPPQWVGSHNWGAVQAGAGWTGPVFYTGDSHADGTKYTGKFRVYATDEEGCADFLRVALVHHDRHVEQSDSPSEAAMVLDDGNVLAYAQALRKAGYFEAPPQHYAKTIFTHAQRIARSLGQPLSVRLDQPYDGPRGSGGLTSITPIGAAALLVLGAGGLWALDHLFGGGE